MRIFIIDQDLAALDLVMRALEWGHEVLWFLPWDKVGREGQGIPGVTKTSDLAAGMRWAKTGLVHVETAERMRVWADTPALLREEGSWPESLPIETMSARPRFRMSLETSVNSGIRRMRATSLGTQVSSWPWLGFSTKNRYWAVPTVLSIVRFCTGCIDRVMPGTPSTSG